MAWKPYTPSLLQNRPPMSAVALTIPPKTTSAQPILLVDDQTVKLLGWQSSTALAIAIGDGEHDGQIRITPEAGAPTTLFKPNSGHYRRHRIRLGRMPCLGERPFRGPVEFRLDGMLTSMGALIVILPGPARALTRQQATPVPAPDQEGHKLPPGTAAAVRRAMGR